jgi:monoamine oxidase
LGSLAFAIAQSFGKEELRLGQKVVALQQYPDHIQAVACTGERFTAKSVIFALPPAVAANISISPQVSPARLSLQRRYVPFSRLKFHAVYPRPFWRDAGLSGEMSGGGFLTFDGSTSDTNGVVTGFFGTREALEIWRLPQRERASHALSRLAKAFGPEAMDAIAYDDRFWLDENMSMGCVAAPGPGVWSNFGAALRQPEGRIFYAGAETSPTMPGQVEGAIFSGEVAALAAI